MSELPTAIHRHQELNNQFGNFLDAQSCCEEAIEFYQQSSEIAREIGNRNGEAASFSSHGYGNKRST